MKVYYKDNYGKANLNELMDSYDLSWLDLSEDTAGELVIRQKKFYEYMSTFTAKEYDKWVLCIDCEPPYSIGGHKACTESAEEGEAWDFYPITFSIDELKALDMFGLIDIGFHLEELASSLNHVGFINGRQLLKVVPND